jgi:hypothetical protein
LQVNKTLISDNAKNAAREISRNVQSSKASQAQSASSIQTTKSSIAVSRSVLSMINSAALPADKLSASIITFAKFFSLPLKPEIMAAIRRQSLAQPSGETIQDESLKQTAAESKDQVTAKYRDALSMSAAAAESKGVELNPKGLEAFAEAVDPELRDRQNNGRQNRGKQNKNQNEQKEDNTDVKPVNVNASSLEKMASEYFEKDTLLDLLNKLPGKDGRRWVVVPLNFSHNGKEYHVSLKIFLEMPLSDCSGLMALDVAEEGSPESRMSFVLEAANNQLVKLSVYSRAVFSKEHKSLKSELSKLLEIPVNQISVKTCGDSILCAGCNERFLTSIDEVA